MKFFWIVGFVDLMFWRMVGRVFLSLVVFRLVRILLRVCVDLRWLLVLVLDLRVCMRLGMRFGRVFLLSFLIKELRVCDVVVWVVGIGFMVVILRLVMRIGKWGMMFFFFVRWVKLLMICEVLCLVLEWLFKLCCRICVIRVSEGVLR